MQSYVISSIFIVLLLLTGSIAEDPKGTVEDQIEAKAEESVKEELDTMKKTPHDERVADPEMFKYATARLKKAVLDKIAISMKPKELTDENLKKKLSPQELALMKVKYEKKLEAEIKLFEKHMAEDFEKNKDRLSKLTKEDVENMIKELNEDFAKADEKFEKGEL